MGGFLRQVDDGTGGTGNCHPPKRVMEEDGAPRVMGEAAASFFVGRSARDSGTIRWLPATPRFILKNAVRVNEAAGRVE